MNKVGRIQKVIVLSGMVMVGVVASVFGQTEDSLANRLPRRFVHGLGVEARPEYVFPTHPFLRGENPERKLIRGAFSTHLNMRFIISPEVFTIGFMGMFIRESDWAVIRLENPGKSVILLPFICFREHVSPGFVHGCRLTTNGISDCLAAGNPMMNSIILTIRWWDRRSMLISMLIFICVGHFLPV